MNKRHFRGSKLSAFRQLAWSSLLIVGSCASVLAIPTILSTDTSTRAIALEAVTMKPEPFPLQASVQFSTDTRTRITVFMLNLDLLPGEGASAFTADGQDGNNTIFPFTVESVNPVPGFEAIQMITIRLDNAVDSGDMLLRVSLHGVASNRVRIGVGHVGGGPQDDAGAVPTPAPQVAPSPTPTPTPNPYTDPAYSTASDSVRFLEQSSFGPTASAITHVQTIGYKAYLNEQFSSSLSSYPTLALVQSNQTNGCPAGSSANCGRDNYSSYPLQLRFYTNAMYGQDQLRQRVSFALNQIMVVSGSDVNQASYLTPYLQIFDRDGFGNFRTLLGDITLNPAMGSYLDMAGNNKSAPNENYAREVLQLFSVGLYKLNLDGTVQLDSSGNPVPTYDQPTITNFARVFTGWNIPAVIGQPGVADYINPMTLNANNHDIASKTLLNGAVSPAGSATGTYANADLNLALDNIFNHPNVGPFIGRQLIQHLVTSNPSPAYVARVASAFNNNGQGVRGDMKAVITAILLDPEARGDVKTDPSYGHLREPALYITSLLRGFNPRSADGTTTSDGYLAPQSQSMDQDVLKPATVFNFYSPDYGVPGTAIDGPEFQIFSATTSLKRANFANTMINNSGITVGSNSPNGTSIDLSGLQALAGNPANSGPLLDALNTSLMHGTMSASMRGSITTALSAITGSDTASALSRARTALYLVITSSQYQVER